MKRLRRAQMYCDLLTARLLELRGPDEFPGTFRHLSVFHSDIADQHNAENPRQFCFVEDGKCGIFASAAIECIPSSNVVGVLLHEIGHIAVGPLDNVDEEEVLVDAWCGKIPVGYGYATELAYTDHEGRRVVAHNIQQVKPTLFERWLGR